MNRLIYEKERSKRNGTLIFLNGYKFRLNKILSQNITQFKCSTDRCPAKLNFKNFDKEEEQLIDIINEHNCSLDKSSQYRLNFMNRTKDLINQSKFCNPHSAYLIVLEEFSNQPNFDLDNTPLYLDIKSSLSRTKNAKYPKIGEDLSNINFSDKFTKTLGKDPQKFLQYSNQGKNDFLIFFTEKNLELLSKSTLLIVDGTFDAAPLQYEQLVMITALVGDHSLPLVYGLLPDKQEETYAKFFNVLKNALA